MPNGIILPGEAVTKRGHYLYQCPRCRNAYKHDEPIEPVCTGPSWTDDHEPTPMAFKSAP